MPQFYSNGKLLLTGEYLVLDGALALAIPTKLGQSLSVQPASEKGLFWKSLDMHGNCWFQEEFSLRKECTLSTPSDISKTLQKILREAQKLNPDFLTSQGALQVTTRLDFPRDWGLGSSSTLINNIAQWAEVDAFQLLKKKSPYPTHMDHETKQRLFVLAFYAVIAFSLAVHIPWFIKLWNN